MIVGTGIAAIGQVTLEALSCITHAERLLYLVVDPVTESWLVKQNPTAQSLYPCYVAGESRSEAYRRMTEAILQPVREGRNVCVALYGHPGVFVQSSHDAIRIARSEGHAARMLAGVSTEDCLFADLLLDPGPLGCQTYEATAFVVRQPAIDCSVPLILLQVGYIGETAHKPATELCSRTELLRDVLLQTYAHDHQLVVYERAAFPTCESRKESIRLDELAEVRVSGASTILIPPCTKPQMHADIMTKLYGSTA